MITHTHTQLWTCINYMELYCCCITVLSFARLLESLLLSWNNINSSSPAAASGLLKAHTQAFSQVSETQEWTSCVFNIYKNSCTLKHKEITRGFIWRCFNATTDWLTDSSPHLTSGWSSTGVLASPGSPVTSRAIQEDKSFIELPLLNRGCRLWSLEARWRIWWLGAPNSSRADWTHSEPRAKGSSCSTQP